jgi:hypothetical protein
MKRVFVTTNLESSELMYNRTGYETEKEMVKKNFNKLPMEYSYDNDCKVIVLEDTFTNWGKYNIDKVNDYVLCHTSSAPNVIDTIKQTFKTNHYINGSHILEKLHDKVYQILLNDKDEKDKFKKILDVLGFTEEKIKKKVDLKFKLNLLHKCLSPETLQTITESDLEKLTATEKSGFEIFIRKVNSVPDPFDEKYVQTLSGLRTTFLYPK